jgi:apoptogenic protein 1
MSKHIARRFHILVGPPHPVSNLRPVLYNGLPHHSKSNAYSPHELRDELPVDSHKFQLDLTLQRIDKYNHEFWVQVHYI